MHKSPALRFMEKVRPLPNGCWEWTAATTKDGYGRFGTQKAHRWIYEQMIGPIPPGRTIDHTCHSGDPTCELGSQCPHRRCVNPAHMQIVTPRENFAMRRKPGPKKGSKMTPRTRCLKGHPLTEANIYISPDGRRRCRICKRDRERRQRASP